MCSKASPTEARLRLPEAMKMIERPRTFSDAQRVRGLERMLQKLLGRLDGRSQSQPLPQMSGDCGRECAARPMRVAGRDTRRREDADVGAVEEDVVACLGLAMAALDENGRKASIVQASGDVLHLRHGSRGGLAREFRGLTEI